MPSDAGRCLVTFIPQHAGTYVIDVTFNGLQVHGKSLQMFNSICELSQNIPSGCPIRVEVRERQVFFLKIFYTIL